MSKVIGIEYTLKDANTGDHLDSNVGQDPLEFVSGKGQIIPGLESKLVDMSVSEEADVLVEPKDAYGELNPEAVQTLPKEQFAGIELTEGMSLYGTGEQGETVQVTVTGFNDNEVTIDYNHPMAGKTLMFSVAVLSSRAATEEEIQTGVVGGMAAMGGGCCGGGSHDHGESEGGCCSSEEPKEEKPSHGGCGCSH
ncbi:MAG: FKBP-type peptidyl-prolyl cis-trans isomerase [Arcobacter sp.]|uniref:FKBP-type peptidyl-prolyl cis-trans isomerase n=1 Tax=Arcobacter sp. TaxID=1872629 RepID=UPI003B0019FD